MTTLFVLLVMHDAAPTPPSVSGGGVVAGVLVRPKLIVFVPVAFAPTLYGLPEVALAVTVEEVASPFVPVVAMQLYGCGLLVQPEEAKVPLSPADGAENVTDAPD